MMTQTAAQRAFNAGVAQAQIECEDTNEYTQVLYGVAQVLQSADWEGSADQEIRDVATNISRMFHDPLSITGLLDKPIEEIIEMLLSVLRRFSTEQPSPEVQLVLNGSLPSLFSMRYPDKPASIREMRDALKRNLNSTAEYTLGRQLSDARASARFILRRVSVLAALGAKDPVLDDQKRYGQLILSVADHLQERAQQRVQDLTHRVDNWSRRQAERLQPLESLRADVRRSWSGTSCNPDGPALVDSANAMIFLSSALSPAHQRDFANRMAEDAAPAEGSSTRVYDYFWRCLEVEPMPATLLGYLPGDPQSEVSNYCYIEYNRGEYLVVDADRARLALSRTGFDEVRVGQMPTGRPVVIFYRQENPVGLLAPLDVTDSTTGKRCENLAIDVDVALAQLTKKSGGNDE